MIGLINKLKAQAGKTNELEAMLHELSAMAKKHEPGMLSHHFFKSREEPDVFVAIEVFKDQAALTTHGQTQHFKDFLPRLGPLVDRTYGGRVELFDVVL